VGGARSGLSLGLRTACDSELNWGRHVKGKVTGQPQIADAKLGRVTHGRKKLGTGAGGCVVRGGLKAASKGVSHSSLKRHELVSTAFE